MRGNGVARVGGFDVLFGLTAGDFEGCLGHEQVGAVGAAGYLLAVAAVAEGLRVLVGVLRMGISRRGGRGGSGAGRTFAAGSASNSYRIFSQRQPPDFIVAMVGRSAWNWFWLWVGNGD